jgi:hypothetical protein
MAQCRQPCRDNDIIAVGRRYQDRSMHQCMKIVRNRARHEMFFAIMSSSFVGMTKQSRLEPEVIRPLLCLPFCSTNRFAIESPIFR